MASPDIKCDHFIRATPDIEAAYKLCVRLGLPVNTPRPAADTTADYTVVTLGAWPKNIMFVEYMTHYDHEKGLATPGIADLIPLLRAGGGMRQLVFAIDDLEPLRRSFAKQPGGFTEGVTKITDSQAVHGLTPGDYSVAGCRFGVVQYPSVMGKLLGSAAPPTGDFPLKRVDHMAIIPPDFEAATRFWTEVMGLPIVGEVEGRGLLIRQLQVGDMVIELLKSTTPDGPIANAQPGLLPVLACEVDDVAACVALARERGFNPRDPAPGILPGTLVSSIPGHEMSGIEYQLLQYV
jgi:catechol 2,3-dioxygenase-like lactoylglutathione lyase family enzyme